MKRIDRSAIVEHSAAQIFALVEDIEAYPRFLPWCVAATVDERGPASLEYDFSSRALAKLLEPLFARIADTMVDAFTQRAARVYGGAEG